jgi:hypothetical protein
MSRPLAKAQPLRLNSIHVKQARRSLSRLGLSTNARLTHVHNVYVDQGRCSHVIWDFEKALDEAGEGDHIILKLNLYHPARGETSARRPRRE